MTFILNNHRVEGEPAPGHQAGGPAADVVERDTGCPAGGCEDA